MRELDCEESWALKNWCFWTVVLEKTLEGHSDCRKSNQSILKEISLGCSLEGMMLKLKLQYWVLNWPMCSVMSDSFSTPQTVAHQAPLPMGFSRREQWSEWVATSFFWGCSWPRDWTLVPCIAWPVLYHTTTKEYIVLTIYWIGKYPASGVSCSSQAGAPHIPTARTAVLFLASCHVTCCFLLLPPTQVLQCWGCWWLVPTCLDFDMHVHTLLFAINITYLYMYSLLLYFFNFIFTYLFIFGCTGSPLLPAGFL